VRRALAILAALGQAVSGSCLLSGFVCVQRGSNSKIAQLIAQAEQGMADILSRLLQEQSARLGNSTGGS
jgi:hypothetical protein